MKILIIPNPEKEKSLDGLRLFIEVFAGRDCELLADKRYAELMPGVKPCEAEDAIKTCDVIVPIGGDGSIIYWAKTAALYDRPILGINSGRLGFNAVLEINEIPLALKLLSGEYKIEERMTLTADIRENGEKVCSLSALNDVVLSRAGSRIIDIELLKDGEKTMKYRADGLIFSTSTGSTAYSMSAGGPVLYPDLWCVLATPICPHSLFSRSIVFSDKSNLEAIFSSDDTALVSSDGDEGVTLLNTQRMNIYKSGLTARFIKIKDEGFSSRLLSKFL